MNFILKYEQEVDGSWIAEVPELPGVVSYGDSADRPPPSAFGTCWR